jgi:AraC-like DNA-binding protein
VTQEIVPRSVVLGPCTYRRAELVLGGRLDVFTISFQASGFHQIFGVPMTAFADQAYDAPSVIGPVASEIEEKLAEAPDFHTRVRIVTIFLMRLLREGTRRDFVAAIANRFLQERGALRIGDAAASTGLSIRQFERRFAEEVGLPPKRYAKIVRFQAALEAKIAAPTRLWTDIAHEVGYYDQMHMVRDFERFAGESPTSFIKRFGMTSEPWA